MVLTRQAFWYLRHGETDWNAEGRSQGNVDTLLHPQGVAQARAAAAALLGRGIRSIVTSPMRRALDTAVILADTLGLPVEEEAGLRKAALGDKEGLGQPNGGWYDDWLAGRSTPPGAETFATLRLRVATVVNRAIERASLVLIVGHGTTFRALRAEMGLPATVREPNGIPLFCEPGESPDDAWRLTTLRFDLGTSPNGPLRGEGGLALLE